MAQSNEGWRPDPRNQKGYEVIDRALARMRELKLTGTLLLELVGKDGGLTGATLTNEKERVL